MVREERKRKLGVCVCVCEGVEGGLLNAMREARWGGGGAESIGRP